MALPLLEKGYKVHLISNRDPGHFFKYTSRARWHDLGQCIEAVKIYSKVVDIFHAHNEPSWFVTLVKEYTDKPVILDVHDSFLARSTPDESQETLEKELVQIRVMTEERNNFQLADGLVFPSIPFGNMIREEYKLTQPYIFLPSYCTREMQQYSCRPWLGGLVYEGRIDLASENHKNPLASGFKYTDYEAMANKCNEVGLNFHLYGRNDKPYLDIFEKIALTHNGQPFTKLLECLSRHDWGLVGNLNPTPEWDVAFPNKMFEYISACLPVVALNAHECGRFLTEEGLGIEVQSVEELCERWSEHTEIRKNVIRNRQKWVMENHIHKLEELYATYAG
jgi:hypothetical protein